MFSLTIFVLMLPIQLLYTIGEPFKYVPESSLANKSEYTIRDEYGEKKVEHYVPRIIAAVVVVMVSCLMLYYLYYSVCIIAAIIALCILVDVFLMSARAVFFRVESKDLKKKTGKALALTGNEWKDTGINGILKLAEQQRKEAEAMKQDAKAAHKEQKLKVVNGDDDDY